MSIYSDQLKDLQKCHSASINRNTKISTLKKYILENVFEIHSEYENYNNGKYAVQKV